MTLKRNQEANHSYFSIKPTENIFQKKLSFKQKVEES